jgi:hypothetical protein
MPSPTYHPHHANVNFNVPYTLPRPRLYGHVESSSDENQKLPPISWLPAPHPQFTASGGHEHRDLNSHESGMDISSPSQERQYASLQERPNGTDWQGHQRRPPPPEAQHEYETEDSMIPMEE